MERKYLMFIIGYYFATGMGYLLLPPKGKSYVEVDGETGWPEFLKYGPLDEAGVFNEEFVRQLGSRNHCGGAEAWPQCVVEVKISESGKKLLGKEVPFSR